jgi:Spy/CpxP family protein refolding chaperone
MMRRSVVVLAAVLCAAGTAFAQAPPSPSHADWQAKRQQWEQKWKAKRAEMEQKRMDRLAVLLDMTPAQKQQVQTIFSGERDQMKQAMKQAMEARKAAHTQTEAKLGQVLSATQMQKLKLLMPHRHRFFRMRGRMGMHGGMGPMGKVGPMGMWHPHPGAGAPPPPGGGSQ